MKAYPYQTQIIQALRDEIGKGKKRVLLVLDTGGGKTFIFSMIAAQAQAKGKRVLILTDRLLLSAQSVGALKAAGCSVGVANQGIYHKPVTIGTIQTISKNLDTVKAPDIVIIDEAHEGIFKKSLEYWPEAIYIGCTGTPVATSKKEPLKDFWETAVSVISRPDLIEMGRLVPLRMFDTTADLAGLRISSAGDYTEASQLAVFGTEACYTALKNQLQNSEPRKTVVFCGSVAATEETAARLKSWGYKSWVIVGATPPETRDANLAAWKAEPNGFLVNCMVATKGFDAPELGRGILLYATTSLAKYYQTVGRVCRANPGKEDGEIWDYGGNLKRFWHPDRAVDWVGLFENPTPPGQGTPPMKECKQCESLILASAKVCNFCGHEEKPRPKKEITAAALVLKETGRERRNPVLDLLESAPNKNRHANIFRNHALKHSYESARELAHEAGRQKIGGYKPQYWIYPAGEGIMEAAKMKGEDGASVLARVFGAKIMQGFFAKILANNAKNVY